MGFWALVNTYPQSLAVTFFFAIFGLVIAILKDVPDITGDAKNKIKSFSVKNGPQMMFKISWQLLFGLLVGTSVVTLSLAVKALQASGYALTVLQASKFFTPAVFAAFAVDVKQRAIAVKPTDSSCVFNFYMYVWKIFYACYLILPFAK